MDPQQRLVLETAWEALEDAGEDVQRLAGSSTAVFVGQWLSDFEARLYADPEAVDFYMTTGSGRYATSGRLSYALGVRGPSATIDTACSSSLVAVHLAVRSLRSGESELAIAGGANVILQPHISIAYSQSSMMAPDGRCKFGDASGDGYVRSEGAGLVVLKPLDRARADGNRIYATIRGSAINNDGRSSGSMGTPSRTGQEELLRRAYADAAADAAAVAYVECHGTGTRAGDPVELGALQAVLGEGRPSDRRAYVGSVKTNFGHTEGAAGVAGLIKVALALHHGAIPPSLHFRQPNPSVPWDEVPFAINTQAVPWPDGGAGDRVRLAGVSAFGIAGTNAHVVLESAPPTPTAPVDAAAGALVLPLAARSGPALRALAARYADRLADVDLRDLCFSAQTRRTALSHRAAFVAEDRAALADALVRHAAGESATAEGVAHGDARPRIAFVAPGQGAQYAGMARELLAREPVFRAAFERCDRAAQRWLDGSLIEQVRLDPDAPGYRLDGVDFIQPTLVALAIAYAELLRSLGIVPDVVVGHSMGEVAAAHLAGVLDLDAAMRIICRRSALMKTTSGRGAMALVELSMDEARARIRGRERQLAVAVVNSPRSSVLSGDPDAVQEVLAELERDQIFCRLVKVDVASHSPQMETISRELARELADLSPGEATTPIVSAVMGARAQGSDFDASYWARNLRQPVLFARAVEALLDDDHTIVLELGPHPVLVPSVEQTARAADRAVTALACGRRDAPEQASVLGAVAAAWAAGYPVEWRRLMPGGGRAVELPLYPWQRERHWIAAADPVRPSSAPRAKRPDDESLAWLHQLAWRPAPPAVPGAASRWLVWCEDERGRRAVAALQAAGLAAELAPLGAVGDGGARVLAIAGDGDDQAYLPVRIARALPPGGPRPRIWLATTGAQAVGAGEASPEQAALWGAARVVGAEHPELWGGLIDLEGGDDWDALVAHLAADDGEDQVAIRGGERFGLRLTSAKPELSPIAFRADATYLITGGLGAIGRRIARTMVELGARRLLLVGRTALPPRAEWADAAPTPRVAPVLELEAAGAEVHTAALDVGDETQLRALLDRWAREARPPIRGVVHAAGQFANRLTTAMTKEEFDAVVRAKLGGARLLDRLLPDLDFFALFSSTGGFMAQPGQANYAAANAGLDAIAHSRRARGRPAVSIAWGVWAGTGLVDNAAGAQNVAEMARQGIQAFAPERGAALFPWLAGGADPTIAVLPVDWAAFRRARAGRDDALYRELEDPSAATATPELQEDLARAAPGERRTLIEALVADSVCRVLKVAPARLDRRRALGDMGLSSLLAMELRNRLEAALGRPLSATIAWNYPTVAALANYLAGDPPAPGPTPGSAPEQALDLTEIADLSDDDIAQALRARRTRGEP
jgi:acyl transferase domain-containing protein/acyl carrier protein